MVNKGAFFLLAMRLCPLHGYQECQLQTSQTDRQTSAWIYECLPLTCEKCGQPMRLIAFIMEPVVVEKILSHIGEPIEPPAALPARAPPRWRSVIATGGNRQIDRCVCRRDALSGACRATKGPHTRRSPAPGETLPFDVVDTGTKVDVKWLAIDNHCGDRLHAEVFGLADAG